MFNIAIEILIHKLCNMHGVPIAAWDIGLIPVTTMATQPQFQGRIGGITILHSFGVRAGPQKFIFFIQHKWCITWFQKGCTALEKRFRDVVRRSANLRVLLKDGCGTWCTPFPNLFEINTLHTTIYIVLKWSQSICGAALMLRAPTTMCQQNVLDLQNCLQAVP